MPDDRNFWETRFVDAFVTKSKRVRYKKFIRDPGKRDKILDRLNHNADLDFDRGIQLAGSHGLSQQLIQKLSDCEIETHCWLISDDPELDCKLLAVGDAAELTANADWGTVMICPPRPIAVYRAEAPVKSLYLFA